MSVSVRFWLLDSHKGSDLNRLQRWEESRNKAKIQGAQGRLRCEPETVVMTGAVQLTEWTDPG